MTSAATVAPVKEVARKVDSSRFGTPAALRVAYQVTRGTVKTVRRVYVCGAVKVG